MKNIEIRFEKPVNGYWDGGMRSGGVFEEDRFHKLDDDHICFGSWMLNFFFNVKKGRSEQETISRAKRYLKKHCKTPFRFVVST
jgi:hypothetical protein